MTANTRNAGFTTGTWRKLSTRASLKRLPCSLRIRPPALPKGTATSLSTTHRHKQNGSLEQKCAPCLTLSLLQSFVPAIRYSRVSATLMQEDNHAARWGDDFDRLVVAVSCMCQLVVVEDCLANDG